MSTAELIDQLEGRDESSSSYDEARPVASAPDPPPPAPIQPAPAPIQPAPTSPVTINNLRVVNASNVKTVTKVNNPNVSSVIVETKVAGATAENDCDVRVAAPMINNVVGVSSSEAGQAPPPPQVRKVYPQLRATLPIEPANRGAGKPAGGPLNRATNINSADVAKPPSKVVAPPPQPPAVRSPELIMNTQLSSSTMKQSGNEVKVPPMLSPEPPEPTYVWRLKEAAAPSALAAGKLVAAAAPPEMATWSTETKPTVRHVILPPPVQLAVQEVKAAAAAVAPLKKTQAAATPNRSSMIPPHTLPQLLKTNLPLNVKKRENRLVPLKVPATLNKQSPARHLPIPQPPQGPLGRRHMPIPEAPKPPISHHANKRDNNRQQQSMSSAVLTEPPFVQTTANRLKTNRRVTLPDRRSSDMSDLERKEQPKVTDPLQSVILDHNYSTSRRPQLTPPQAAPKASATNGGVVGVGGPLSTSPYAYGSALLSMRCSSRREDDAASAVSSGRGREAEPEGEETETAPEGEGDEDSITRCICDYVHDDGYMICCDKCSVWQHVDCMGIDRQRIPDDYLCERCNPRHVERARARALQTRKREELNNTDTSSDSSSSAAFPDLHRQRRASATQAAPPTTAAAKKRALSASSGGNNRRKSDTAAATAAGRKSSAAAAANNNGPATKRQRRESSRDQQPPGGGRDKAEPHGQPPPPVQRRGGGGGGKKQAAAAVAAAKGENKRAVRRKSKAAPPPRPATPDEDDSADDSADDDDACAGGGGATGSPDSHRPVAQLRTWIDNYEEAVTNHYSPELRARLASIKVNGAHAGGGGLHNASNCTNRCRVAMIEPGVKALLTTSHIAAHQPIIELRGKHMLSGQQKIAPAPAPADKRQASVVPYVFFYRLPAGGGTELCVDARTYGNDARFVRRSCRPNAEVFHHIDKGALHVYIVSLRALDKGAEITVAHDPLAAAGGRQPCACGRPPKECLLGSTTGRGRTNGATPAAAAALAQQQQQAQQQAQHNGKPARERPERRGRARRSQPAAPVAAPAPTPPAAAAVESPPPPIVEPPPPPPPPPPPAPVVAAPRPVTPVAVAVASPPPPTPPPAAVAAPTSRRSSASARTPVKSAASSPDIRDDELSEPNTPTKERRDSDTSSKDKMTREERKLEAIMKAFERMDRERQRKEENQGRQKRKTPRKHSEHQEDGEREPEEPAPPSSQQAGGKAATASAAASAASAAAAAADKPKRKRRKGRGRANSAATTPTPARRTRQSSEHSNPSSAEEEARMGPPNNNNISSYLRRKGRGRALSAASVPTPRRRTRFNSAYSDSDEEEEADQPPPAPSFAPPPPPPSTVSAAAGMLLALTSNNNGHCYSPVLGDKMSKTPIAKGGVNPTMFVGTAARDCGSSAGGSTPPTTLSSACLLVAAAVGPLAPGFKFPKTKKGMMNEWLNKSPDFPPTPSPTLSCPYAPLANEGPDPAPAYTHKGVALSPGRRASLGAAAREPGSAKKRWLRQAISEEGAGGGESPPPGDAAAPLKKRRLARESVNSEESFTPPTTPTEQHGSPSATPANNLRFEDDETMASPPPDDDGESDSSDHKPPDSDTADEPPPTPAAAPAAGGCEIVSTLLADPDDSPQPPPETESEMSIGERVAEMKREFEGEERKPDPATLPATLPAAPVKIEGEEGKVKTEVEVKKEEEEEAKCSKRKLSISEYRKRKQLGPGPGDGLSAAATVNSARPSAARPSPRSRLDSTSSSSSSSSFTDDDDSLPPTSELPRFLPPDAALAAMAAAGGGIEKGGKMIWNSAPTLVERQRENLTERLKRQFGICVGEEGESTRLQGPFTEPWAPPPPPEPPLAPPPSPGLRAPTATIADGYVPTVGRPNGQAYGAGFAPTLPPAAFNNNASGTIHNSLFGTQNPPRGPQSAGGHFVNPNATPHRPLHTVAAAKAYYPVNHD